MLLLPLFVVALTTASLCRGSVVWLDDGVAQTVKAVLSPAETVALTEEMLEVLGLPDPRKLPRHHRRLPHGSAPQWLKKLHASMDDHGRSLQDLHDGSSQAAASAAETIITFVNREVPGGRPAHGGNKRLWFSMDSAPLDHSLLGAELHVHRLPREDAELLILNIYLVSNQEGTDEELVTSVPLEARGWMAINVTEVVLSWVIRPNNNYGLRLSITWPGKRHELHFRDVGVTGAHDSVEYRPFLVGFFAVPDKMPSPSSSPQRRIRKVRSVGSSAKRKNPYVSRREYNFGDNICMSKHLHVSFRDLGWQDWVLAPEGYNANFCSGHCEFPLQNVNATNHAIVQTLVRIIMIQKLNRRDEAPTAVTCAPTDLATISILYYDYDQNIVLKKYPNMIVKSCGCQ